MFLSNRIRSFAAVVVFASLFQACGSSGTQEKSNAPLVRNAENRFPFPTREPDVYQGDLYVGNGTDEQRYFVARKNDNWRYDIYRDDSPATTQLRSGDLYVIDHARKTYYVETPANPDDFGASHFNQLSWGFFRGANYLEFEEIARENGIVRYKAKMSRTSKDEVVVSIDEASGIMVRQEILGVRSDGNENPTANYIYEVRNLKLDVDDSVFHLPSGYRKVSRDEGRRETGND
ncbi:MAG: hypothetical protein AB7J13_09400 [Pyrinomonadaceae bacterium]